MKMSPATLWRRNAERKEFLGQKGEVVSFSVIYQAPPQLEKRTPYILALIRINKSQVISQIVDCDAAEVTIGMQVLGVVRKLFDVDDNALHVYGVKFIPIEENS